MKSSWDARFWVQACGSPDGQPAVRFVVRKRRQIKQTEGNSCQKLLICREIALIGAPRVQMLALSEENRLSASGGLRGIVIRSNAIVPVLPEAARDHAPGGYDAYPRVGNRRMRTSLKIHRSLCAGANSSSPPLASMTPFSEIKWRKKAQVDYGGCASQQPNSL